MSQFLKACGLAIRVLESPCESFQKGYVIQVIIYYTHSQKTKVFAQALHSVLGLPLHELGSDLNNKTSLRFLLHALYLAISGKNYPATNMPSIIPSEIYVCGPVWGGHLAGPVRYFLDNCGLKKTKVNILITAAQPVEKYKENGIRLLSSLECIPGRVLLFATGKGLPELDVVSQQIREILNDLTHDF